MTCRNPRLLHLRIFLSLPIVFCTAAAVLPLSATAGELPAEEAGRITALLAAVESMADAAFIRNGQTYYSAVAAEFLRRKWQAQASNVASVKDFIEKVASFSSATGQPYLIRFGDGREIPCSVFFRAELAKLQRKRP